VSHGTVTPWMMTGPRVGSSSVAWETPAGVMTSIAFGTVAGSTEQIGLVPPAAHLRGHRAQQVRAHDAYRSDHEKPQDGQEGHPDEGKRERVHSVLCPRLLRRCRLAALRVVTPRSSGACSSYYLAAADQYRMS